MRRTIVGTIATSAAAAVAAVLALGGITGSANAFPAGGEGCFTTTPGQAAGGVTSTATCSYTATRWGHYVAAADSWSITVSRMIGGSKSVVRVYRGSRAGGPDGACHAKVIAAGDIVDVAVTNGTVFVGDPQLGQQQLPGAGSVGLVLTPGEQTCPA
ncbi:MAG: hypothetical protein QOK43_3017 [Acidimicrobiaceae bacterium]|nr:hypothetical protein [Acidimicrobiaceae bacterium]